MDREAILSFINANPACHLAMAQDSIPHVRGVLIYRADGGGIVFHTGKSKDLYSQLIANPAVEFCFGNRDMSSAALTAFGSE